MSMPFVYPRVPYVRRHGPRGYSDYASYLPWLRDEFSFRCVYCLTREQWGRVQALYAIDHFLPVAQRPDRVTDYDNLLYACASCNALKRAQNVPDPLTVLTSPAVRVTEDGTMHAETAEAATLVESLWLNRPRAVEFRRTWISIIFLALRYDPELYRRLMAYPDDLPDLRSLRPPGGNSRPEGLDESAFSLRQRGELPDTY